jgi:anti-sigma regulatory factor (Ser/Thr protein kinase)
LTDRRARAGSSGHYTEEEALGMLCRAVSASASGDANAIARAAEESVPGDIDDDMAILVVRSLPDELDARERVFPAEPVMVSEARCMALDAFQAWGLDSTRAELACLLVSEVVTNAVLHTSAAARPRREFGDFSPDPVALAGDLSAVPVTVPPRAAGPGPAGNPAAAPAAAAPLPWDVPVPVVDRRLASFTATAPKNFAMRLRRGSAAIWVEVFDPDMRLPRIRTAEDSDEGGRGLYLVEQLATRWGTRPTRNGKAVWFEMPIDGERT